MALCLIKQGYVLMAWHLVKHRDKFSPFTFISERSVIIPHYPPIYPEQRV